MRAKGNLYLITRQAAQLGCEITLHKHVTIKNNYYHFTITKVTQ